MNSDRTLHKSISEGFIKDQLIPALIQLGYIEYEDEVSMDLGPWNNFGDVNKNGRGTIPLTLRIKSSNDNIMEKIIKNGKTG